jgi:uncharacterized protein YjiS (DUF1127 family)
METDMAAKIPVLPLAVSTALRASLAAIALVTHWVKTLARARRHRREAHVLAGLDRRMLADIGITRADVRDAFSEPFWEDPTALLRERALERRVNRSLTRTALRERPADNGFRRPRVDRPARQAI